MDNFQIETAQNIQIAQNVANLGDRILAFVIDVLIIIAYEFVMFIIMGQLKIDSGQLWVLILVFGLPPFLYHLILETLNNGQSIGKAAMRIRVVKLDGTRPQLSNYLLRWLLRLVDIKLTSGACALFTILLNDKGQRLGDIAAKTTVISEKQKINLNDGLLIDLPEDHSPIYPQVTVFSDRDMQTIKDLFHRARKQQNYQVIDTLAEKTASLMTITPKGNTVDFLEQVIKDYNFYTQQ